MHYIRTKEESMEMTRKYTSLGRVLLLMLVLVSFARSQSAIVERPDFGESFSTFGLKGSFLLYDAKQDTYLAYDSARCRKGFIPASTYKIFNSLVGLETGVIPDENFIIPWDSVTRGVPSWNKDQTMAEAFRNSTVWYYQELARRVGAARMQKLVTANQYGNMDISGGIDRFWLTGALRITQYQQIDLLRKLHENALAFSPRSMEIVKRIMILKDTSTYVLRGKTGWADIDSMNYGWFVGYLEQRGNVYYFAISVEACGTVPDNFVAGRRAITEAIFKRLGLL
jgi:beta-lactamase class D